MNKLKNTILAAASLTTAVLALPNTSDAGEVLDRVHSAKTLTVAVGTDWGPISHLNKDKELDGYDVDLAKAIAKSLGVDVNFVTPGWDIITAGKWQGRWDLAMGQMTPTKARAEVFDFPAVYIWGPIIAVAHKDSKATKLPDLEGKIVGVAAGTAAESYANHKLEPGWLNAAPVQYQFKPGEIKAYTSTNIAFDDLRLGDGVRLDVVLTDDSIARDAIKAGYPLKMLEKALFSSPGAAAVLKGDKEFSAKIAAAVKALQDNGTLAKLSIKWYGADLTVEQ
jgi:polar amino acid transport system substrate-binding protein